MRGSRLFFQRGFNFDNVFLVDEGREDPNSTILKESSNAHSKQFTTNAK